jgi:flagellar protein FlaG
MRIEGLDSQSNVQQTVSTEKVVADTVRENAVAASGIVQQNQPIQKIEQNVSEKMVKEAVDRANKAISGWKREFRYSVHDKTKEIMVKVIDPDSGDIIREIPPEKILDLVAKLQELAGAFVDEKR